MATTYHSPGVYIEEVPAGSRPIEGVRTAVAAFVGLTERGPLHTPTLITNWGQYQATFGDFTATGYTPLSVYHYFNNGGGACYVVRVGGDESNGTAQPKPASATIPSAARPELPSYEVVAKPAGADKRITVEVVPQDTVDEDGQESNEIFTVVVRENGAERESFPDLTPRKGSSNAGSVVSEQSELVELIDVSTASSIADKVPAPGVIELIAAAGVELEASVTSSEMVGDPNDRSGLGGLEAIDDITMVAIPDLMAAYELGAIDLGGVKAVQDGLISHCEKMRCMAILDTPPDLNAQQVKGWLRNDANYDSAFAAAYWPWIEVHNPGTGRPVTMPPSAAMSGLWGRTDSGRGVHKAPANEVVRGATDLALNVTTEEHNQLHDTGLNVIRAFPGRGIRVWGARTLASDAEWRYLNVRRLFNFLEASILQGTQWAVFEPNDLELWQPHQADGQWLPHHSVAERCSLRRHPRAGVLRQVR